jgi:hypothetical protein
MIAEMPLHRGGPNARNVDIPPVYKVTARRIHGKTILVRLPVDDLHLREAYPFFIAGRGGYARHHHELDQLVGLQRQLSSLGLLQPVFRR